MLPALKIGCAVPCVAVADPQQNARQICQYMSQARDAGCDILVFPELALTGHSCADLLRQQLLLEGAQTGLTEVIAHSVTCPNMLVIVGLPVSEDGEFYSCTAVIQNGALLRLVRGAETFAFDQGLAVTVVTGNAPILTDGDIIIHSMAEVQLAGDRDRRRRQARVASKEGVYVCCGAGWSESVTDGVYGGHSLIARHGEILAENRQLVDGGYLLMAKTDDPGLKIPDAATYNQQARPFCNGYEDEVFCIQASALARRLQLLNAKAVVGVSGGLDSTLALLVAVEAMHRLGQPASDVYAITMPGFGTTDRTYDNAMELMRLLGVTVKEISIRNAVTQHFADIGHDPKVHDLTYENAQARERTQILMDYAGRVGGIVVGTGDLSELALGWCTYNGDHMSMYGVNAGVPKTLIPEVIRAAAKLPRYAIAERVLQDVIDTPISPELLPPDEKGRIVQQTEDVVGPYILHDFFLYHTLKNGTAPKALFADACRVFAGEFDGDTVKKWLKTFYRRFFTQQFKRNCMPEGVKVLDVSLSPRGDWKMPGDASVALWLREVDQL